MGETYHYCPMCNECRHGDNISKCIMCCDLIECLDGYICRDCVIGTIHDVTDDYEYYVCLLCLYNLEIKNIKKEKLAKTLTDEEFTDFINSLHNHQAIYKLNETIKQINKWNNQDINANKIENLTNNPIEK